MFTVDIRDMFEAGGLGLVMTQRFPTGKGEKRNRLTIFVADHEAFWIKHKKRYQWNPLPEFISEVWKDWKERHPLNTLHESISGLEEYFEKWNGRWS